MAKSDHQAGRGVTALPGLIMMGAALLSAMGIGPLAQIEGIQAGLFSGGLVLLYMKQPQLTGR